MTPERLKKEINNSDVRKEKNGHYFRIVNCLKCGKPTKVFSAGSEDLINLQDYECVECRGVLKKFEKESE